MYKYPRSRVSRIGVVLEVVDDPIWELYHIGSSDNTRIIRIVLQCRLYRVRFFLVLPIPEENPFRGDWISSQGDPC
jgi:hypothetical protein